jgi:hypothetical protein
MDDDDDRLERWYAANGITGISWRTLDDGNTQFTYHRADGSVVDMNDQYGYDAVLTPYTDVAGRA